MEYYAARRPDFVDRAVTWKNAYEKQISTKKQNSKLCLHHGCNYVKLCMHINKAL